MANKLLDNSISTKDWWKFFKICLGKDAKENIPPLHYQNQTINNPKDKADIFNVFFHSQSLLDETNKDIPTLSEPTNTLDSIHLEIEEVCSILKSLQVGKACGPDMINNRILKEIADSVSPVLTDVFNTSLSLAQVQDIWKRSNVSPVYKKDDKDNVANYRPISLISSVGKEFEKAIHKHVHNFILANQIITPFQSGNVKGIMLCAGKCCKQSVGLLMYLKWFFYLVIATYQIQITNLFLKLSIDIFIKPKGFHLETDTFSRHNWNYCVLCIEIVLIS